MAAEAATANAWPGVSTCRAALNEINAAWVKKAPWSPHKRAISEGRFAQENLARALRMPFHQAQFMIFEWQRTGVLTFEQCDSKTKSRGLRVAQWPDWRGGNGTPSPETP